MNIKRLNAASRVREERKGKRKGRVKTDIGRERQGRRWKEREVNKNEAGRLGGWLVSQW